MNRRKFLTGLICAPAIIRPGILMPISKLLTPDLPLFTGENIEWTAPVELPGPYIVIYEDEKILCWQQWPELTLINGNRITMGREEFITLS